MADAPKVTPGMTLVKTFADPTPNGLIVQRLLKTFYTLAPMTEMDTKEGQLFMRSLNLTCRKLGSVWSHMDRFKKAQTESVEEMKRERENQPHAHIVDESHALFIEFDEFVVQLKSTLDYLAQIPVPIFGANRWRVNTFGDRGEGFLKTLRGCAPEKYGLGIAVIERHLFGEQQKKWLDATIEARDKITHYQRGGVPPEAFAVFVDTNGDVHLPEWATGQTVERFMEVVWQALVFYVEDFLALFLALRLRPGISCEATAAPWNYRRKCSRQDRQCRSVARRSRPRTLAGLTGYSAHRVKAQWRCDIRHSRRAVGNCYAPYS